MAAARLGDGSREMTYTMRNRRVLLSTRPTGIAQAEHFSIDETQVRTPNEGELLVRNSYLSVEPAMRGWIADAGNYAAPVAIGTVMRALAVGTVIESRAEGIAAGGSVAKIVKLEHAWRRLDGRNDDGFQVAPFPG